MTVQERAADSTRHSGSHPVATGPLSFSQRRLWFLDRFSPGSSAYNIPVAYRLEGELDREALHRAFEMVVERHEVLRTTYGDLDGEPFQRVLPEPGFAYRYVDLTGEEEMDVEEVAVATLVAEASAPFDLGAGPVMRVTLMRTGERTHVLQVVMHHIASDGWSFDLLRAEVAAAYAAIVAGESLELADLPLQYREYSQQQLDRHAEGGYDADIEYWEGVFAGDPAPLVLEPDHPRPAVQTYGGQRVTHEFGATKRGDLGAVARGLRCSPFQLGLALFGTFMARYTGTRAGVVGIPITERQGAALEGLIGFFVNTLPVDLGIDRHMSLRDAVARVRQAMGDAVAHGGVPFELIVDAVQPPRDPSRTPLFQTIFQVEPDRRGSGLEFPGLTADYVSVGKLSVPVDLLVELVPAPQLSVRVTSNVDLYDESTINRFAEAFGRFTAAALADPDRRVGTIEVMGKRALRRLLVEANRSARDYPSTSTIPELFTAALQRSPEAVAITEGARRLTYAELDAAAEGIAAELRVAGVGAGSAVAIQMSRSIELVAATLAILRCGAAYVPLDMSFPPARAEYIVEDAGVVALVTFDEPGAVTVSPREGAAKSLGAGEGAGAAAYVMYTSGSTGPPKGVVVPHRAVVRLVVNTDYVDFGPDVVMGMASNPAFDAATFEIWGALLNGGSLVVLDEDVLLDPRRLEEALAAAGVSTMFLTTSLFNVIAAERPGAFAGMRELLVGGEALDPPSIRRVLEAEAPQRILNGYGPTECTTFSAWHHVTEVPEGATSIPIGGPLANTTLHVLDDDMQPCPIGVSGELFVGGDGLAIGYLGAPELTAERFVPDPFAAVPGARLYRTGDVTRRRADLAVEFVARADRQIKLRGFRIEPGEVEAALASLDGVATAVVRVVEMASARRLVAHLVPDPGTDLDPVVVREALRASLPTYMIPSHLEVIDRLPLTANGKLDEAALPLPGPDGPQVPLDVAPEVAAMIDVWSRVLGFPVGPDTDFFDAGGESLTAVKLMAAIERKLGWSAPLSTLFSCSTPEALVREMEATPAGPTPLLVRIKETGGATPLFCLPPAGGNVFCYEPMSGYIGDHRPVYAVQAYGVDGTVPPLRSIPELAARYRREIQAVQPRGPYHLAGFSYGGLLAHEVAAQLAEDGEDVGVVALLDTSHHIARPLGQAIRELPDDLRRQRLRYLNRQIREVWHVTKRFLGRMRHGPKWKVLDYRGKPLSPELAGRRLTHASFAARRRFVPSRFSGKVTFLRAMDGGNRDPARIWGPYSGGLDVIDVPGTHRGEDALFREQHAPVLGARMRELLDGYDGLEEPDGRSATPAARSGPETKDPTQTRR